MVGVARVVVRINLEIIFRELKIRELQYGSYDLCYVSFACGTRKAILVLIPFDGTGMAIDYLAPRSRVEMAMRLAWRRHLLRFATPVRSPGEPTKAGSKAEDKAGKGGSL
jgi:hypothetical protein